MGVTMKRELDTIRVEFIPAKKGSWRKSALWKLLEDYTSDNGNINVPAGFITDGASVPYMFRRVFSPTGRYFGAAIVHDYILVTECDWDKANSEFNTEMKALDVENWRRAMIMFFVRAYSKLHKLFGWKCKQMGKE